MTIKWKNESFDIKLCHFNFSQKKLLLNQKSLTFGLKNHKLTKYLRFKSKIISFQKALINLEPCLIVNSWS